MTRRSLAILLLLTACGGAGRATEPLRNTPAESAPGAGGEAESTSPILTSEAFGPLRFWMDEATIRKLLGVPRQRSRPELGGAIGIYYSAWSWPGVTLGMAADHPAGPWTARTIEVKAPSKLATKAGIRIGSTRKEVEARYRRRDMDARDPDWVRVGPPEAGLIFAFQNGVVTSMSLGRFSF